MGRQWLEQAVELLSAAGIRAAEGFAGEVPALSAPVAAVSLDSLDTDAGTAVLGIRVLSPRGLGGWACQTAAVQAASALQAGQMRCRVGRMQFLDGCDCYCVLVEAELEVFRGTDGWQQGSPWQVLAAGTGLEGVREFTAEQDRNRRLLGSVGRADPVGVSPGTGGWRLKLVLSAEGLSLPQEPFVLTVTRNGTAQVYSGCCTNGIRHRCTPTGSAVEWEGFALSREVTQDG